MSITFIGSHTDLDLVTSTNCLYFFLTQPQPNERQAFIKFGLTTQTIKQRFQGYKQYDIANIYIAVMDLEELNLRENMMRYIFKICSKCEDIEIWIDHGHEFIKGNLDLILRVFLYVVTMNIDDLKSIYIKKNKFDINEMHDWLDVLPPVDSYSIKKLTPAKRHLSTTIVSDINQVVKSPDNQERKSPISFPGVESNEDNTEESSAESADNNVCDKCGKVCKDKRGLTLHSKTCEGIVDFVCEHCNKTFVSQYCLNVHLGRCIVIKKLNQDNEHREKEEIKILREQLKEKEELISKLKHQYEETLSQQLSLRDHDLTISHQKIILFEEKNKFQEQSIQTLSKELNDCKVQNRTLSDLIARQTITNNTNSNNTNFNAHCIQFQLQCFDPSMIQGKIHPPDNVKDIILMLRSLGNFDDQKH